MSNWSSTQLTDLGRALDAKVTAGTTLLSFTKMKLGSGTETAEDIPAMTDLVSPKLVLGISSCAVSASDDTICELISVASSSDVEESFVVRELGVFATDPDVGEILYAVMLDSTPDTMPNENVSSPVTVTYQVNIVSDNASSIMAVIDPAGLVTASVLQAHNDSISAHKMAHWYRQNSKVYEVGDIAFSASLPSYLVLECTTAGTTAATEPDFSGAVEKDTVTDGTVVWTYRNILSGNGGGDAVGTIKMYAGTGLQEGWLDCDGAAVSRTMYPDLFAAIGTTWGAGDGSTTFNLPRSEDLVLQGASTTNPVGTYKNAGLPNITGFLSDNENESLLGPENSPLIENGAFGVTYDPTLTSVNNSGSAQYSTKSITFDASKSNSIYGNSNTVQPPAACVRFMIKAFDGQTPDSALIDVTQYAQELATKADRSLSNLTVDGEAKLNNVVYEDGFAIIYPNGGTEANPANVTKNTRYVETNPFPGYYVKCVAEVFYNNMWGVSPYQYTSNSYGVSPDQFDDDNIVIITGQTSLLPLSNMNANPFQITGSVVSTDLPCRVKVWKIGKVSA